MINHCISKEMGRKVQRAGNYMEASDYSIGLPKYPKEMLIKTKSPNLYREEVRTKRKGLEFANKDYSHKHVVQVIPRECVQLDGGLTGPLKLPWNYLNKTDEDDVVDIAMACEMMEATFRPEFFQIEKRSHVPFMSLGRATFVPLVQPMLSLPNDAGTYWVNRNRSFIRPDFKFVKDISEAIRRSMLHRADKDYQMPCIRFNTGLFNVRSFAPEVRDAIIRNLAMTIKKQKNLKELSYEFAYFNITDAVRVMIGAALGAGHTIEMLYFGNLFHPKSLPIQTESDYFDVYDEIDYDPTNQPTYTDEVKAKAWKKLLAKPFMDQLSPEATDYYFCMALSSFSNLTVLMVNYSWLSKGNGLYLLRLESLRNAKLRKLILLMTPSDDILTSRQVINYRAWANACVMCPCLELHLIILEGITSVDLMKVMVRSMPLVSVHFLNSYFLTDLKKRKPWSFSYVTRFLGSYFGDKLEIINISLWCSPSMVDISITRLMLKCNFLKVFVFRGRLDKFDSIHEILEFLLKNELRLRRIEFHVVDDPCRPEGWHEAVEQTKVKYVTALAVKGISLSLGIWKF